MAANAVSGSASAKNGCCIVAELDEWQRTQFAVAASRTSAYSCELANVTELPGATGEVAVGGKPLPPPTSLISGGSSWIWVPPVALAPAQSRMYLVSRSAHCAVDASQQLWPPATLRTMRDDAGSVRFTTVFAASYARFTLSLRANCGVCPGWLALWHPPQRLLALIFSQRLTRNACTSSLIATGPV